MLIAKNPSDDTLAKMFSEQKCDTSKWVKDLVTGDVYHYVPGADISHARLAEMMHIVKYEKGIAIASSLP